MDAKMKGTLIAAAAAGLFGSAVAGWAASGMAPAAESEGTVRCHGINSCKGKGACATADNACAGQNACKGKAWIETSAEECEEKGGKVLEGEAH